MSMPEFKADRRQYPRSMAKLKVVFVLGSKTFETKSKNISLSGIRLDDSIPWPIANEFCDVYLSHSDFPESIKLNVRIVPAVSDKKSLAFVSMSKFYHTLLKSWLDSFHATFSKNKKAA